MKQEQEQSGMNAKKTDNVVYSEQNEKVSRIINRSEDGLFVFRESEEGYAYGIGNARISKFYENEDELYENFGKLSGDIANLVKVIYIIVKSEVEAEKFENQLNNKIKKDGN